MKIVEATAPLAKWDLPTAEQPATQVRSHVGLFDAESEAEAPEEAPATARRTGLFDAEAEGWT